jgi:hypothetical protein
MSEVICPWCNEPKYSDSIVYPTTILKCLKCKKYFQADRITEPKYIVRKITYVK